MVEIPILKKVMRLDSRPLDNTYFTEEGYLVDHPILTSVGIFEYIMPNGVVRRELRLPENVFEQASLDSYIGKPVIVTHEAGEVTKDNVSEEMIGAILSGGYKDGDDVRAKIIIYDTNRLKQVDFRELSLGYTLDIDETPGIWNGQPYDAIQKNIRINHLALVRKARAGDQARLNIDGKDNEPSSILEGGQVDMKRKDGAMSPEDFDASIKAYQARRAERTAGTTPVVDNAKEPTPTADGEDEEQSVVSAEEPKAEPKVEPAVTTDGEGTEVEEKSVADTVRDERARRDALGDPIDLKGAMAMIAQMDANIEALLAALDSLCAVTDMAASPDTQPILDSEGEEEKTDEDEVVEEPKKATNMDSIDAIVSQKLELGKLGERINLDGLERMNIREAKCKIVKSVNPNMRLDGKSDDYINAAFDIAKASIMAPKGTDYQRAQMVATRRNDSVDVPTMSAAQEARERMIARREHRAE